MSDLVSTGLGFVAKINTRVYSQFGGAASSRKELRPLLPADGAAFSPWPPRVSPGRLWTCPPPTGQLQR